MSADRMYQQLTHSVGTMALGFDSVIPNRAASRERRRKGAKGKGREGGRERRRKGEKEKRREGKKERRKKGEKDEKREMSQSSVLG